MGKLNPTLGRFLTVDPVMDLSDPQQFNAYAYSGNSPITFTDPDGLRHICGGGMAGDCGYEGSLWGTNPGKAQQIANKRRAPGKGRAESRAAFYSGKTLGAKLDPVVHQRLKEEYGYGGSRDFTRAEALEFAAQSPEAAEIVCHALADGVAGGSAGCSTDVLDEVYDIIAGVAEFAYQLTPIPDLVDCGTKSECAGLALALIPGGKVVKLADDAIDAIRAGSRAGRRACAPNSFVPGTKVLMADGTAKPIEDIELGDMVLATDPITGKSAAKTVAGTIATQA